LDVRSLFLIGLGVLIGAAALGAIWAGHGDGDAEVRISVERLDDGRVEVGLQQRQDDGAWGETYKPQRRFLAPDAETGPPRYSEAIPVEIETRDERVASEYNAYLREAGGEIAQIFHGYFADPENPDSEPGLVLCVIDTNDAGIDGICEGLEASYNGAVERIVLSDWDALRTELERRYADESDEAAVAVVTTSVPTTILAAEARQAAGTRHPLIYWIELLDQHLVLDELLFCQISHSGQVIENESDLFWGLSAEVSDAAAAQLGVNLEISAHSDVADQAAAIRECVANGASVIATTLVDPEPLSPAIGEAVAADIPVVSFNSGAEVADSVGTALHIALDDHEAGRIAGEEFNRREVEGQVLCLIHEPNNVGLHDRCNGFEEVYQGSVERWSADDPAAVQDELAARLREGDISAILTLSVHSAWDARFTRAIHEIDVDIAAFGFSVGLANSVINGSVMFSILDHPELQAYMSTVASVIADRWRLDPVTYFDGLSVLIRPQIADAEYMQALIDSMYAE
jgi:ABC-type sugar transport system substrate-binding protein